MMGRVGLAALALAALIAGVAAIGAARLSHAGRGPDATALSARVGARLSPPTGAEPVPCPDASSRALRLLVLGQSNAGNFGRSSQPSPEVTVEWGGSCLRLRDPLPGAAGHGHSIWSRLPAELARRGVTRPVLLHVLAVDAATLAEWNDRSGPLAAALNEVLADLGRHRFVADLVLWQQGEADAAKGTLRTAYADGLAALIQTVRAGGQPAPWIAARSTICRSLPAPTLHAAIDQLVANPSGRDRLLLGPDNDLLVGDRYRFDGCHFGEAGLLASAAAWADAIVTVLAPQSSMTGVQLFMPRPK